MLLVGAGSCGWFWVGDETVDAVFGVVDLFAGGDVVCQGGGASGCGSDMQPAARGRRARIVSYSPYSPANNSSRAGDHTVTANASPGRFTPIRWPKPDNQ